MRRLASWFLRVTRACAHFCPTPLMRLGDFPPEVLLHILQYTCFSRFSNPSTTSGDASLLLHLRRSIHVSMVARTWASFFANYERLLRAHNWDTVDRNPRAHWQLMSKLRCQMSTRLSSFGTNHVQPVGNHHGAVLCMAMGPNWLVSGGGQSTADFLKVWATDGNSTSPLGSLVGHNGPVHAIERLSPHSTAEFATGSQDGDVRLWQISASPGFNGRCGRSVGTLRGHRGTVKSVTSFLSMPHRLLSAGLDGQLILWDLNTQGLTRRLRGSPGRRSRRC